MSDRWLSIWRSFRGLPLWVQLWVLVLVVANVAAIAFLDTAIGLWTAAAIVFVGVVNLPIVYVQRGFSRLLSLTHFVWLPLVVFIAFRLTGDDVISDREYGFGLVVLVVNLISLAFDVLESYRWLRGEREVLGSDA